MSGSFNKLQEKEYNEKIVLKPTQVGRCECTKALE